MLILHSSSFFRNTTWSCSLFVKAFILYLIFHCNVWKACIIFFFSFVCSCERRSFALLYCLKKVIPFLRRGVRWGFPSITPDPCRENRASWLHWSFLDSLLSPHKGISLFIPRSFSHSLAYTHTHTHIHTHTWASSRQMPCLALPMFPLSLSLNLPNSFPLIFCLVVV